MGRMKVIVLILVHFGMLCYGTQLSFGNEAFSPQACCNTDCCCSFCPIGSCSRPPDIVLLPRPCSCDSAPLYSCNPRQNIYPQYPEPRYPPGSDSIIYPVVVAPPLPQQPTIIRPFPKPDYLKPCLCGSVASTCRQSIPCIPIDDDSRPWYIWDFSFLETPQGIALIITVIVLFLLILCLIIGLIMSCIRSRRSKSTSTTTRDYERQDEDYDDQRHRTKSNRRY